MGKICSRQKPMRFLIQGLDAAGKTSFLYRLKLGEVVTTIPTIGFNVESLWHDRIEIMGWDLGGRDKVRPLYRHYYPGTNGLIYVIDSWDVDRLDDALEELNHHILQCEELRDTVVMVLANKQDLKGALGPGDIEDRLREKCSPGFGISVFVMPCSVTIGDGLWEAFGRFVTVVRDKKTEGKVQPGLIPRAWETENKGVKAEKSSGYLHDMKSSWFRDPFQMMKSVLFT